jgi:type III secretion protein L
MTGVIKAESAQTLVRPITRADPVRMGQPPALAPRSTAELALDAAQDEISQLRAALTETREAAAQAGARAYEDGRQTGMASAAQDEERLFVAVRSGVDSALRAWNDRLAGLDALAVLLAKAGLEKLFGPHADQAELVVRTIGARTALLRQESLVRVQVSALDFPEAAALDPIRRQVGAIDIQIDPALRNGDCRIDLQLGGIDLGIASQWQALSAFLDDLAAEAQS